MNEAIWDTINSMGWYYWGPFILLAVHNLWLLSTLSAPVTSLGRAARTFAWLAHLPLLFSPWFNVMGTLSMPLLLVANNLIYRQLRAACRAVKGSPAGEHLSRQILNSIVAKP